MRPVLVNFASMAEKDHGQLESESRAAIRTDAVYVVHTTVEDTLAATRVAGAFADALGVPLTVVHFRTVPYRLPVDRPTGVSPIETASFLARLRADGLNVRLRILLSRDERQAIPLAFEPHSLIVIGGRHHWWGTHSERLCRMLEAAGHFVVFVDSSAVTASTRGANALPSGDREPVKEIAHA